MKKTIASKLAQFKRLFIKTIKNCTPEATDITVEFTVFHAVELHPIKIRMHVSTFIGGKKAHIGQDDWITKVDALEKTLDETFHPYNVRQPINSKDIDRNNKHGNRYGSTRFSYVGDYHLHEEKELSDTLRREKSWLIKSIKILQAVNSELVKMQKLDIEQLIKHPIINKRTFNKIIRDARKVNPLFLQNQIDLFKESIKTFLGLPNNTFIF